jgi:Spy/CpxP family protein refolding chaperone
MKKLFLISILSVFTFAAVIAQGKSGSMSEMFEKIKAEKISFFTMKLNLTPAEAQAFWPVYNEYEKKSFDILQKTRDFESMPEAKISSLSDQELTRITKNYIESFEQEGSLRKEYHKKFLEILPLKKVLLLYRTEKDFRGYLINKFRRGPGGF